MHKNDIGFRLLMHSIRIYFSCPTLNTSGIVMEVNNNAVAGTGIPVILSFRAQRADAASPA